MMSCCKTRWSPKHLEPEKIRALLDPHQYIGTAVAQVERLNEKLQKLYLA